MRFLSITSLLLPFLLLMNSCQNKAEEKAPKLGVVDLQVSGEAQALVAFEKGLLLLHSFEYEDAATAFQKAQELDPNFAMAYWGEAMTCNHGLWREQEYEKGQEILARLGDDPESRLAKAPTELEQDFLQAVEILYGEGTKFERDAAYAKHMAELNEKYPANHEVAAFYALSLLGSVPYGRDVAVYEKGAAIAEGILKENPQHPGALHYLIHSYDDPDHAIKALTAANNYSKVAPDAAHALHMPSHIYVAIGMWDEVIQSNIASWKASVKRMHDKSLTNDAQSYHALHWLLYGYLQQNQLDTCKQIMNNMVDYAATLPSKKARSYMVRMKGAYLMETNEWDSEFMNVAVDLSNLNIAIIGAAHYLDGMSAFKSGDQKSLVKKINLIEEKRKEAQNQVADTGIPMCSAAGTNRTIPNQLDVDKVEIMEMELRGLLAWLKEDKVEAENWLTQAVEKERSVSYSYGPPEIFKPSFELLAEWLLKVDRPEEAMPLFEEALDRGPLRIHALIGQRACAEALGKGDLVKEIDEKIIAVRKGDQQTAQLL